MSALPIELDEAATAVEAVLAVAVATPSTLYRDPPAPSDPTVTGDPVAAGDPAADGDPVAAGDPATDGDRAALGTPAPDPAPSGPRGGHAAGSGRPLTSAGRRSLAPASTTRAPGAPIPSTARMRLLPAPAAARALPAAGPRWVVPPLAADRIRVLRASDRSLVLDCADEDRGARPSQDPVIAVRRLALASVEVIAGSRPAAQLARWVTPGVLDALRRRAELRRVAGIGPHGAAPAVRHARVCVVDEHVVEGAVVIEDGRRVRAVAIRLETHRGAWRATALEVG